MLYETFLCNLKPVFHFNRIVAERSVFHCFMTTQAELMTCTQWNTLRFATIRLKWKTGFTATFSFIMTFMPPEINHSVLYGLPESMLIMGSLLCFGFGRLRYD